VTNYILVLGHNQILTLKTLSYTNHTNLTNLKKVYFFVDKFK